MTRISGFLEIFYTVFQMLSYDTSYTATLASLGSAASAQFERL